MTRISQIRLGNDVDTEGANIGVYDADPSGAIAAPRGSLALDIATPQLLLNRTGLAAGWEQVGNAIPIATYQGIDPDLYAPDTLLSVTDINTVFRVLPHGSGTFNILVPEMFYQIAQPYVVSSFWNARIKGDILATAETAPKFTWTGAGAGTQTTDGTHYTLTTAAGADRSFIGFGPGPIDVPVCMHGLITWVSLADSIRADTCMLRIMTGAPGDWQAYFSVMNGRYEFMYKDDSVAALAGTYAYQALPVALNVEHHVSVILLPTTALLFQNGVLVAAGEKAGAYQGSGCATYIGDQNTTNGTMTVKLREFYGSIPLTF